MSQEQTDGRKKNGATPGGKPDGSTSKAAVKRTGRHETQTAGPDGPDASVIGETFKHAPGEGPDQDASSKTS